MVKRRGHIKNLRQAEPMAKFIPSQNGTGSRTRETDEMTDNIFEGTAADAPANNLEDENSQDDI